MNYSRLHIRKNYALFHLCFQTIYVAMDYEYECLDDFCCCLKMEFVLFASQLNVSNVGTEHYSLA